MERVKANLNYLQALSESKPQIRKAILCKSDCDQIRTICDCVLNLLLKNIDLDDKHLQILRRRKRYFRNLVFDKNLKIKQKRQLLSQSGTGWMTILLPAAIETFRKLLENGAQ